MAKARGYRKSECFCFSNSCIASDSNGYFQLSTKFFYKETVIFYAVRDLTCLAHFFLHIFTRNNFVQTEQFLNFLQTCVRDSLHHNKKLHKNVIQNLLLFLTFLEKIFVYNTLKLSVPLTCNLFVSLLDFRKYIVTIKVSSIT